MSCPAASTSSSEPRAERPFSPANEEQLHQEILRVQAERTAAREERNRLKYDQLQAELDRLSKYYDSKFSQPLPPCRSRSSSSPSSHEK